jgi:hypothetical protein
MSWRPPTYLDKGTQLRSCGAATEISHAAPTLLADRHWASVAIGFVSGAGGRIQRGYATPGPARGASARRAAARPDARSCVHSRRAAADCAWLCSVRAGRDADALQRHGAGLGASWPACHSTRSALLVAAPNRVGSGEPRSEVCQVDALPPAVHGSALFERGTTHTLCSAMPRGLASSGHFVVCDNGSCLLSGERWQPDEMHAVVCLADAPSAAPGFGLASAGQDADAVQRRGAGLGVRWPGCCLQQGPGTAQLHATVSMVDALPPLCSSLLQTSTKGCCGYVALWTAIMPSQGMHVNCMAQVGLGCCLHYPLCNWGERDAAALQRSFSVQWMRPAVWQSSTALRRARLHALPAESRSCMSGLTKLTAVHLATAVVDHLAHLRRLGRTAWHRRTPPWSAGRRAPSCCTTARRRSPRARLEGWAAPGGAR